MQECDKKAMGKKKPTAKQKPAILMTAKWDPTIHKDAVT